jgi:hypothetical protein
MILFITKITVHETNPENDCRRIADHARQFLYECCISTGRLL